MSTQPRSLSLVARDIENVISRLTNIEDIFNAMVRIQKPMPEELGGWAKIGLVVVQASMNRLTEISEDLEKRETVA